VWIPGAAEPDLKATGITNLQHVAVDGGWSVTGCAKGDYSLTSDE
jgi:hypothetical protein